MPPGVLRRKELRRQRRSARLRQLWRILVFSGMSVGLGYLLLRQGWTLREPNQVEVLGSAVVSRDQVIAAAGLRFPQPLMALQPRLVASDLMGALPVEQVKVSRLMLPPRLRVELKDREAVARAVRRTDRGPEMGSSTASATGSASASTWASAARVTSPCWSSAGTPATGRRWPRC